MTRLLYLIITIFLVWLSACAFCIFFLDFPKVETMKSAGISAIMIFISFFIHPYLPEK